MVSGTDPRILCKSDFQVSVGLMSYTPLPMHPCSQLSVRCLQGLVLVRLLCDDLLVADPAHGLQAFRQDRVRVVKA